MELLRRTTRSVAPTEAGELVAARARAVLAETDALRGDIDELRGLTRGHVNIGAMLFGGELDIPAVIARFTSSFPDVEVGLREGTAQRMLEMLSDGSLDVAFALEVRPPDDVQRLELSSEELAVATSTDHTLAGSEPLPVRSLAGTRLIAFQRGSSTREVVDAALARFARCRRRCGWPSCCGGGGDAGCPPPRRRSSSSSRRSCRARRPAPRTPR
jgi:DNA-binding transcriptional LysR family regulator